MDRPFVVTVASEKGGVGKTTIATNLAVYLKALREDLPVTIASFDNHFSIDQMFAIGRHRGGSVAGLFTGVPAGRLAAQGEYGVQFLASERHLEAPDSDPTHLQRALASSGLPGLLLLDTRPVLDYFTRNALLAADLVLVPVKDRPSLVNAASLLQAIKENGGDTQRIWLLPSLIDVRLKLRHDLGIRDFLVLSARERGYQVLDSWIPKSPKVEGLATGLSARVYPVLTHARNTAAHSQLRDLADFVLGRMGMPHATAASSGSGKRQAHCPVCRGSTGEGFYCQDMRGHRRGGIHSECLDALLDDIDLPLPEAEGGLLVMVLDGSGLIAPEPSLALHLFSAEAGGYHRQLVVDPGSSPFAPFLQGLLGRSPGECYREIIWVDLSPGSGGPVAGPRRPPRAAWHRQALREAIAS